MTSEKTATIEGIVTGEPGVEEDVMYLRLRRTDYGERNNEVLLETYTYGAESGEPAGLVPENTTVLDEVQARKLIVELAKIMDIELTTELKLRKNVGLRKHGKRT